MRLQQQKQRKSKRIEILKKGIEKNLKFKIMEFKKIKIDLK